MNIETGKELSIPERATLALGLADIEKSLTELSTQSASITEITNPAGYEQCHASRMVLKNQRIEIEKRGKAAREEATAFSKAVIAAEKKLIGIISPEEERLQKIQDAWDTAREAEKQAKIAAELRRVSDINDRIIVLRGNQSITSMSDPKLIADHIADLEKIAVDDSFEEFKQQAADAKAAGIARLTTLHTAAVAHQVEQERIKAERAELERLRAEEAERNRVERERIAAEEAQAKAIRDEEAAKQAEALAAERAEQNRIAAERQAALDAEAARLAAERAEVERQQEALRKAQEPAPKPKGKAKRPSDAEIIGAVASHFSVDKKVAVDWILAIDFSNKELAA